MLFSDQAALDTFMGQINVVTNNIPKYNFKLYNYQSLKDKSVNIKTCITKGKICSSDIGREYISEKLDMVEKRQNSDILILLDEEKLITWRGGTYTQNSVQESVVGFIISEKGECAKYNNVHSLSLICTKPGAQVPPGFGVGSILLGAYLYMIKAGGFNMENQQQLGILDLASSFINVGGFCSYRKFGFQYEKDKKLYQNCYNTADGHYANLPMVATITDKTTDYIVNLVNGKEKVTKGKLCDDFKVKEEQQLYAFTEFCLVALEAVKDDNPSETDDTVLLKILQEEVQNYNPNYTVPFDLIIKKNGTEYFTLPEAMDRVKSLQESKENQLKKDIQKIMPKIAVVAPKETPAIMTTRTRRSKGKTKYFRYPNLHFSLKGPQRTRGGQKTKRK